jgi:plasmid replication initiation protein
MTNQEPESQRSETAITATAPKPNRLIEGKHDLSLLETKLFFKMLSKYRIGEPPITYYGFSFDEFISCEEAGGSQFESAQGVVEKIMSRVITVKKDDDKHELVHLVGHAEIVKSSKTIRVRFDPEIKPYLEGMVRLGYTKFHLRYIMAMKSVYSIRLYELLLQYPYKEQGSREILLEDLRFMLGIPKKTLKEYGHFKSRVLLKAQKDLTNFSNISFEFKENKQGKKVHSILFTVSEQEPKDSNVIQQNLLLQSQLMEKPMTDDLQFIYESLNYEDAQAIEADYPEEEFRKEMIKLAKNFHDSNKGTIGGFLITLCKKNYTRWKQRKINTQKVVQETERDNSSIIEKIRNKEPITDQERNFLPDEIKDCLIIDEEHYKDNKEFLWLINGELP